MVAGDAGGRHLKVSCGPGCGPRMLWRCTACRQTTPDWSPTQTHRRPAQHIQHPFRTAQHMCIWLWMRSAQVKISHNHLQPAAVCARLPQEDLPAG